MIILKLYLIVMRNVKLLTRVSFLKLPSKNFSFFYKFNNNEESKKSAGNIKDSINVDILVGLQFAYRNLIEALYDRDYGFLSDTCEESLAKNLEKSMKEYKDELFISSPTDVSVELSSLKMEIHMGITTNRNRNSMSNIKKSNSFFDSQKAMPFNPSFLNSIPGFENLFNFYRSQDNNSFIKNIVIRLNADIKTNLILSRHSLNADVSEIHNVMFELESSNPNVYLNILSQSNILKSTGFFRDIPASEHPEKIIISDFDNFMKGNPLIKV